MGPISSVIAWIGFGIAAGLFACMLPFHRGARNIVVNVLVGVLGAVAGGLLGRVLGLYPRVDSTFSFLLAAAGALALTAVFHVAFAHRTALHP